MLHNTVPMAGGHFDDGGKMVRLVAPHGANDGDFIDDAANMRKPIGHRNARFAVVGERPLARDDRALHLRQIVPEADGIDQSARPLIVLGIKSVDMADTTAHEQKDDRLDAWSKLRNEWRLLEFAFLRPKRTHGRAEEANARLKQKFSTRNSAARVKESVIHAFQRRYKNSSRFNKSQAKPLMRSG